MKNSRAILGLLIILTVMAMVWLGAPVEAQQGVPPIPHAPDARLDCNLCHATGVGGSPKMPADHTGRTNEMCSQCHQQGTPRSATPAAPGAQPTRTADSGPARIPHPLQNREDCLGCHATGVGGAAKVPASHAGRTNDKCRTCHQTVSAAIGEIPLILPTPIPHIAPPAPERDSCVTCHTSQVGALNEPVKEWQTSIHAERNVRCVDCHGGDATKPLKEDAHAAKAGYTGKPNMVDIPALCASCHARVELMRQYDLPTDQWSKYQQSIHGIRLAQANFKVATCYTCHDGHATKKTNDPTSRVYPSNVPSLCANCHSNVEYMKEYKIPTNQHALYIQSVHGKALLERQDLRAPSCATCHGTHGAAPPGFEEVANVCGSCHTATQDYYLKSAHASGKPGTPKCVTCHGRYDVFQPTDELFVSAETRACTSCHPANSPQADAVRALYDNIRGSARTVEEAEKVMQQAERAALIIAPEETRLAEAKTNLITARAAQHALSLPVVKERTDKATAKANEIVQNAKKAISEEEFRRQVMGIGLVIMALSIASLVVVRRELYRQLPPE